MHHLGIKFLRKIKENIKNNGTYVYTEYSEQYFSNITSKRTVTDKEFGGTINPFLTKKVCLENSDIMLINDDEMVTYDISFAKTFNEYYTIHCTQYNTSL